MPKKQDVALLLEKLARAEEKAENERKMRITADESAKKFAQLAKDSAAKAKESEANERTLLAEVKKLRDKEKWEQPQRAFLPRPRPRPRPTLLSFILIQSSVACSTVFSRTHAHDVTN